MALTLTWLAVGCYQASDQFFGACGLVQQGLYPDEGAFISGVEAPVIRDLAMRLDNQPYCVMLAASAPKVVLTSDPVDELPAPAARLAAHCGRWTELAPLRDRLDEPAALTRTLAAARHPGRDIVFSPGALDLLGAHRAARVRRQQGAGGRATGYQQADIVPADARVARGGRADLAPELGKHPRGRSTEVYHCVTRRPLRRESR
jgi:hypothetical protein